MSMLPEGIIPIGEGGHGRVFDFVCESGATLIADYSHLTRDAWAANSVEVHLGGEKKRITLTSIDDLRDILNKFLSTTLEILSRHTPYDPFEPYTYPDFSDLKSDILIEQLIFDVLVDKYLHESKLMSRNSYSNYMAEKLYTDPLQRMSCARAINENLRRGMESHYNIMKHSHHREQIKVLGVDPIKYDELNNPKIRDNPNKKWPKVLWDYLYHNYSRNLKSPPSDDESNLRPKYGRSTITARQYRRQLTRDSRNYSYKEIVNDLKSYDSFVTKLLPVEYESNETYFRMSMDYYILESYKRVDFIFKLVHALDLDEIAVIDRKYFLVSWFVPCVLVPCIQDGELHFGWKYKYYRPLFIIEDMLLKEFPIKKAQLKEAFPLEAQAVSNSCERYYESQLKKYQYVRAKTFELFKYHCTFRSNDYAEIKKFLCSCYDMRTYHHSNTFWNLIRDSDWEKMDNNTKQQLKDQIRSFLSINDAFFWKSSDRDYTKPKADN